MQSNLFLKGINLVSYFKVSKLQSLLSVFANFWHRYHRAKHVFSVKFEIEYFFNKLKSFNIRKPSCHIL